MSGKADAGSPAYVFIAELAKYLGVGAKTVRTKIDTLGIVNIALRNPQANNQTSRAIRAEDAKRIAAEFKQNTGAHVLTPDEISKLMEEA